jgi:hypothetical protein
VKRLCASKKFVDGQSKQTLQKMCDTAFVYVFVFSGMYVPMYVCKIKANHFLKQKTSMQQLRLKSISILPL